MNDASTALYRKPAMRWPLRLFIAVLGAAVIGFAYLGPELRPYLVGALLAAGGYLAWSAWDALRGRAAALEARLDRWRAAPGVLEHEGDLHFKEDGQPLLARLDEARSGPTVAVLTPLRETTAAFRIANRALPLPGFDGREPAVGGPSLSALPGVQLLLHDALIVEGNEPAQLQRWLDEALVSALVTAVRDHPDTFRGLTFDGRFLAVHWVGAPADDPGMARALSAPLWRPFVPRLPPTRLELLN